MINNNDKSQDDFMHVYNELQKVIIEIEKSDKKLADYVRENLVCDANANTFMWKGEPKVFKTIKKLFGGGQK